VKREKRLQTRIADELIFSVAEARRVAQAAPPPLRRLLGSLLWLVFFWLGRLL
jgi:hypothetical protein